MVTTGTVCTTWTTNRNLATSSIENDLHWLCIFISYGNSNKLLKCWKQSSTWLEEYLQFSVVHCKYFAVHLNINQLYWWDVVCGCEGFEQWILSVVSGEADSQSSPASSDHVSPFEYIARIRNQNRVWCEGEWEDQLESCCSNRSKIKTNMQTIQT